MILSIDQGTTNTKAVLVDEAGRVVAVGSTPVQVSLPRPGWVEQDGEDIWNSVLGAIGSCLDRAPANGLSGIAVSNQRESVIAWRRSDGSPLGPVIGWQDQRAAGYCSQLPETAHALVRRRSGLALDSMFSAPKFRWLLDSIDGPATDVCLGTIDSWLLWKLTAGAAHLTEAGNASRTLLFDVCDRGWSEELLEVFDIPSAVLPEVVASTGPFGKVRGVPGLPDGLPVVAVMADSHAALYGHGCTEPGGAKATYGTGTSVMSPVRSFASSASGVPYTLAWVSDGPTYAREGNILSSGSALAWIAQTLGLAEVAELTRLAAKVPDSGGVTFVPAFSGLAAPHWDRAAVASISGMTQGSTREHLARAALEGVAHQIVDVLEEIEADSEVPVTVLRADGGATESGLLMQIQADLSGCTVALAAVQEVSALGAALMGWHALGAAGTAAQVPSARARFAPLTSAEERGQARAAWRAAVARSRAR